MSNIEEQTARAQLVQTKYADMLMHKAHVIGVGIGFIFTGGQSTGEVGLVVMVDSKQTLDALDPVDQIPLILDGVRVDVREVGIISAL